MVGVQDIVANVAALIYYKYTPLLWSAADYLLVTLFAGKSLGSDARDRAAR